MSGPARRRRPDQLRPGASPGRRESTCAHLGDRSTNQAAAGTGLALNGSSLRDLGVLIPITRLESRYCYLLSLPPVSGLGNFLAAAAFLGCGSRFSGSLSGSNPNSPSPVNTMDQPGSILERPSGASTAAPIESSPQHPGPGASAVEQKLKRSDFVCESTKSIRDCRIHMGP
ncbi:hypothetical protein H6P81_016048 [Aristolochia fimbriata]|uniref:Uncharacterized protein n=1 Tax=Aristolochia fimbriata TaxID=158543 RepID=A0AAV7EBU8_ARIFI|nr:hypothetical protein H6P81_016048 [Aristolochia fimbriata]